MRDQRNLVFRMQWTIAATLGLVACSSSTDNNPDVATSTDVFVRQDVLPADSTRRDTAAPDASAADQAPVSVDTASGDVDNTIVCPPAPTAVVPSGTASMQAAGPALASTATRPQLTQAMADGQYTISKALAKGGTITESIPDGGASTPDGSADASVADSRLDAGAGDGKSDASGDGGDGGASSGGKVVPAVVSYSLNDDWDPVSNGIGDASKFAPVFTVAADGSGTHTTVQKALTDAILLTDCARAYIRIMPGEYRESVTLASKTSAPPITLYSTETDASKTRIVFNKDSSTAGGMSNSATFTIKALTGFQAKNLTFANDAVVTRNSQSAVALLNQSDRAQFENVRVLGHTNTLYVKTLATNVVARAYFRDCTIEGDQEIIVGRGTTVFDHTTIKYLSDRQPKDGVIAAPSTMVNNRYGFLFVSCQFTAEAGASGISLGYQWWESSNDGAVGKMIVRNSTLGNHLAASAPWAPSPTRVTTPKNPNGTDPVTLYTSDDYFEAGIGPVPAEVYLGEYGNTAAP
jgi:pectinesterase